MAVQLKLTKNGLRLQQQRLAQLTKYLPTLQLKKAMLQTEVNEAKIEIAVCREAFTQINARIDSFAPLLTETLSCDILDGAKVSRLNKRYENIAGIEIPYFEGIEFEEFQYDLFSTPQWVDQVVIDLRKLTESYVRIQIAEEKWAALSKALREVSTLVNLFEKRLIPETIENIRKIKVFLGDQQLAAVSQAKVAKDKIEKRALERERNLCVTI